MIIRLLEPRDREAWAPLWQGYLDFYKVALSQEVTDAAWQRINDADEPMHGLGAFDEDGRLLGIAHYIFHRSTWSPDQLLLSQRPVHGARALDAP